jgi:hypothetical protein
VALGREVPEDGCRLRGRALAIEEPEGATLEGLSFIRPAGQAEDLREMQQSVGAKIR